MTDDSTTAYADVPRSGRGPGVLLLGSWWGLSDALKDRVNQLADAGFTAIAPDLLGTVATDDDHGRRLLAEADPNQLVAGVQSCADALSRMPATPDAPIAVVGLSMGGSLGLWYSERFPDRVSAVVSFYGSQQIDFTETRADYQLHLVEGDPMVDDDEVVLMAASIGLAGRHVERFDYAGVSHHFAEPGTPSYDPDAAELAWSRSIDFLRARTS